MKYFNRITENISKRKLLLIIFGLVIAIYTAFILLYFPSQFEKQAMEAVNLHAESIAEMAAVNLGSAMYFEDIDNINQVIENIANVQDVAGVAVFNKNDTLMSRKFSFKSIPSGKFFQENKTMLVSGTDLLVVTKPVLFNDEVLGKIVLSISLKRINTEVSNTRKTMTIISIGIFLLGLIAVFWVTALIRRPLSNLMNTFWRIAAGDLSIRAEVDSTDEFGALARSFNKMVDELAVAQSDLENINRTLEDRVEERTYQLTREIEERKIAETQIQILNKELEFRVKERTSELEKTLKDLQIEVEERLKVEEKLRFSDKVLKRVGAVVIVTDSNANIVYCSDYISVLLGFSAEEVLGKNWALFYSPENGSPSKQIEQIAKIANSDEMIITDPYRLKVNTKDGSTKWMQWQDMKGEGNTVVFVGHDVTQLIEAEAKLLKANHEIEVSLQKERELNELKTRFVSMISHEYRTPLTVILTSTSLLKRFFEISDKENFDKFIYKITSSVDTMTKLLEDVLIIGRSEAGRLIANIEEINPAEIIVDSIDDINHIYFKSQKFEFIDYSNGTATLKSDTSLIKQIITNLLSNAAKYSPNNSTIKTSLSYDKFGVEIKIQDTGMGMSQDDVNRIFDLFHRGGNVGAISGTGLGMPIVKRCVEALKGKIEINSKLGEGTEFIVKLPNID